MTEIGFGAARRLIAAAYAAVAAVASAVRDPRRPVEPAQRARRGLGRARGELAARRPEPKSACTPAAMIFGVYFA